MLPGSPYARRIMMESASFAVIPSLGPLVRGHSLICPREHLRSFAGLGWHGQAEFREIKARLSERLGQLYGGELTFFEHGMAADGGRILCTVEHAHLHVLPLTSSFSLDEEGWIEFDGTLESLKQLSGGREYLCYESSDGVSRILTEPDREIGSQYMRRVIARGLVNAVHWNWREEPNPDAADANWREFVEVFGVVAHG